MTKAKVYLWLHAAICITLAAYLSLSAISMYREGSARKAEHPLESIYTPEGAAEKLAKAAPLFLVGVGLLIAGHVMGLQGEGAERPAKVTMIAERGTQKKLRWIGWGLFALCMVPVLVYFLDPAHFPKDDLEGMFFGLMRVLIPWTAAGLGSLAVCSSLGGNIRREIQAEQSAPVKAPGKKGILQAAVMTAAIVFIIAGICNQSARDVLYKAVTICTECVGLG